MRLLLVEDNPGDILLVQEALVQEGLDVEMDVAKDGATALEFISNPELDFDLVLLDLNIPKNDGIEVLTRLRNERRWQKTPVIVITSSDSPEDHRRVMLLGASHYFSKPAKLDQFLLLGKIIRQSLGSTRALLDV
jgi:CheY-like chemotaxis protein